MGFNLKEDASIKKDADTVGGGDYLFDSDVHECRIDMAYIEEAKSGAVGLHLHLIGGQKRHRESFYVTSGKAKGQKNFYLDRDGNKRYLPGFNQANELCKVVLGKDLDAAAKAAEKKTIDLYDWNQRKAVPTEKDFVLTELIGKTVEVGIIREKVNKRGPDGSGGYKEINEMREQNAISKFFQAGTGLTANDIESGNTSADFKQEWLGKNQGVTRDHFKAVPETSQPDSNSGGAADTPFN